ncbi:hypothetical protein E2C01_047463 [Portunus trituberculatus]|uniref:Uncharacterized protein n=1 Tax=Portunus trituberculatus TaxID=210409 RepID=A0A5B7G8X5_PORTR|nr:hypothetical protein [Portunus trituberculatus]
MCISPDKCPAICVSQQQLDKTEELPCNSNNQSRQVGTSSLGGPVINLCLKCSTIERFWLVLP